MYKPQFIIQGCARENGAVCILHIIPIEIGNFV